MHATAVDITDLPPPLAQQIVMIEGDLGSALFRFCSSSSKRIFVFILFDLSFPPSGRWCPRAYLRRTYGLHYNPIVQIVPYPLPKMNSSWRDFFLLLPPCFLLEEIYDVDGVGKNNLGQ